MEKVSRVVILLLAILVFLGRDASATPSTHIWSPSTDVQAYGVFHLTADMYLTTKSDDDTAAGTVEDRPDTVTNLGLTVGVLPFQKVQLEVGFDHITGYEDLDDQPMYFNAKLGIPEGAFGDWSPAVAVGGYMFGTDSDYTDYDIRYAKIAKTINPLGRFSVGYYKGNDDLLVDKDGDEEDDGILLCWERTMSEISDNLWLAIDYMGGDNGFGALAYGFSWKFAPNTSVIFGYVDQNEDDLAGVEDWFTVQVDIDFAI